MENEKEGVETNYAIKNIVVLKELSSIKEKIDNCA